MYFSLAKSFFRAAISLSLLLVLSGCDAEAAQQVTFLELLNTVFLGFAAAGGYAILRNV